MRTIPRTHLAKIEEIKASAVWCMAHDRSTDYAARECDPEYAWTQLAEVCSARLIEAEPGRKYVIRVHGEKWYDLLVPPAVGPYKAGDVINGLMPVTYLTNGTVIRCEPDSWRWPNHWRVTAMMDGTEGPTERTYIGVNSKGESDAMGRGLIAGTSYPPRCMHCAHCGRSLSKDGPGEPWRDAFGNPQCEAAPNPEDGPMPGHKPGSPVVWPPLD